MPMYYTTATTTRNNNYNYNKPTLIIMYLQKK